MRCNTGTQKLKLQPLHHNTRCSSRTSTSLYCLGSNDSIPSYLDQPLPDISETWRATIIDGMSDNRTVDNPLF